jgi:hypothetical protein
MKPFIVKFNYVTESERGKFNTEEMFLCLHADDRRDAFEKYLQVTGSIHTLVTPGAREQYC